MSETRILIRLLRIYFPRISEFGSASEFRGGGGGWAPQTPPRYATDTSPAAHFKTFQVFLIYCPKRPSFSIIKIYTPNTLFSHNLWWAEGGSLTTETCRVSRIKILYMCVVFRRNKPLVIILLYTTVWLLLKHTFRSLTLSTFLQLTL
jgi:hypothetical protein